MPKHEQIKIKKLNPNAIVPTYGTKHSAGADLYACTNSPMIIVPGEMVMIKTGLAIEIPHGYVGLVYARSGLATKSGLAPANKVGVIDSDYRGEIMVPLFNHSKTPACLDVGERVAQLVIVPYIKADYQLVEEIESSPRGEGGFGSTGKK